MATTSSTVLNVAGETAPPADSAEAAEPQRRIGTWDVLGVLGLASLMFALERLVVVALDVPVGRAHAIEVATAACWVAFGVGLVALLVAHRPALRSVPRLLTAVWRDPPGPWAAFALGVVLATPVMAVYAPVLFYDSDASRIVAAVRYVERTGDLSYFPDTQEPFLPHVLFGPALALGGIAGAKLLTIVSVQVLSGVLAYISYRVTGQMLAAATTAMALLCLTPVYERASTLPMYPTMLALGCWGTWLGYQAMSRRTVAWRLVLPAGICLALSPEAHGTGLLFLAGPLLLVVFAPTARAGLRTVSAIYGVVAVAMLPRLIINLSVGGLQAVTSPRSDYWITRGYLVDIQNDFWSYAGVTESIPEFLGKLPDRFVTLLGAPAWVMLALAVAGLVLCARGRTRLFALAALGFLVAAVTIKRIPPFSRYYAPFWPGLVILAGAFVAAMARRRTALARAGVALCLGALVVASTSALRTGVRNADARWQKVEARPIRELVAVIDDGKGVIGSRPHQALLSVTDDVPTWGDQFLAEDEYVTYLTWPSEREVLDVFERHDIGWVLIVHPLMFEMEYNDSWLVPNVGRRSRHVQEIPYSDALCRVFDRDGYVLFKVGACTEPNGLIQAEDLKRPGG